MKTQAKNSQYTLKPSEIKKLFANAGTFRNRCMLKLIAYCGLRRFEVVKIRIGDLDFDRRRLRVIGKAKKEAVLPVPQEVLDDLKHYIGSQKEGWLFPSIRNSEKHLEKQMVNYIVKKAGIKAGLTNPNPRLKFINPHILRHSCARIMKDAGMSIEAVQQVMRHASYKTTMDMYGTKSQDDVQEEYEEKLRL